MNGKAQTRPGSRAPRMSKPVASGGCEGNRRRGGTCQLSLFVSGRWLWHLTEYWVRVIRQLYSFQLADEVSTDSLEVRNSVPCLRGILSPSTSGRQKSLKICGHTHEVERPRARHSLHLASTELELHTNSIRLPEVACRGIRSSTCPPHSKLCVFRILRMISAWSMIDWSIILFSSNFHQSWERNYENLRPHLACKAALDATSRTRWEFEAWRIVDRDANVGPQSGCPMLKYK